MGHGYSINGKTKSLSQDPGSLHLHSPIYCCGHSSELNGLIFCHTRIISHFSLKNSALTEKQLHQNHNLWARKEGGGEINWHTPEEGRTLGLQALGKIAFISGISTKCVCAAAMYTARCSSVSSESPGFEKIKKNTCYT